MRFFSVIRRGLNIRGGHVLPHDLPCPKSQAAKYHTAIVPSCLGSHKICFSAKIRPAALHACGHGPGARGSTAGGVRSPPHGGLRHSHGAQTKPQCVMSFPPRGGRELAHRAVVICNCRDEVGSSLLLEGRPLMTYARGMEALGVVRQDSQQRNLIIDSRTWTQKMPSASSTQHARHGGWQSHSRSHNWVGQATTDMVNLPDQAVEFPTAYVGSSDDQGYPLRWPTVKW